MDLPRPSRGLICIPSEAFTVNTLPGTRPLPDPIHRPRQDHTKTTVLQARPGAQSRGSSPDVQCDAPVENSRGPQAQAIWNFRQLMQQRRALPFPQDKARGPRRSSTAESSTSGDATSQQPSPRQGMGYEGVEPQRAHQHGQTMSGEAQSQPVPGAADGTSQDAMSDGRVQPVNLATSRGASHLYAAVVVMDPRVMGRLGSTTSGLLDQYQSDVSRGCDEGVCAQFYMERIQSCRREFWLSQLTQGPT